jgi:hypothetical protein
MKKHERIIFMKNQNINLQPTSHEGKASIELATMYANLNREHEVHTTKRSYL